MNLTLQEVETIRSKLNARLKELGLDIHVEASFIMMVGLLLEEIKAKES